MKIDWRNTLYYILSYAIMVALPVGIIYITFFLFHPWEFTDCDVLGTCNETGPLAIYIGAYSMAWWYLAKRIGISHQRYLTRNINPRITGSETQAKRLPPHHWVTRLFQAEARMKLREMLLSNEELNRKFAALERKLAENDENFKVVFTALRKLIAAPEKPRRQIGFKTEDQK